jgi:hypothetical protein
MKPGVVLRSPAMEKIGENKFVGNKIFCDNYRSALKHYTETFTYDTLIKESSR